MKTIDTFGTFEDAISKSPPDVQRICIALRRLISRVHPAATEVPWPKLKVVGYGIGPKKSTGHFCYIAPFASHANLGFNHGADLADPRRILEGGGKGFRHVKIRTLKDVMNPGVKILLRNAVDDRLRAMHGSK